MIISISEPAKEYLAELLAKQNVEKIAIRVFVSQPGTPHAETCIVYCKPGEEEASDIEFDYDLFKAFIDKPSIPYLEDAEVDFAKDKMGGQLTIKAPNAKAPKIDEGSPLSDRVNHILYTEVNPALAAHGGVVSLVDIVEDNIAVLQFGGGCQGCGMVDVTLKQGVETTLMERLPELAGVKDVTDHSDRENAYYK